MGSQERMEEALKLCMDEKMSSADVILRMSLSTMEEAKEQESKDPGAGMRMMSRVALTTFTDMMNLLADSKEMHSGLSMGLLVLGAWFQHHGDYDKAVTTLKKEIP